MEASGKTRKDATPDILVQSYNLDELLKNLKCPLCDQQMSLPITFCTKGHNVCNDCRTTLDECSICQSPFSGVRNLNLENISSWSANPCPNEGCSVFRPKEFIEDHLLTCQYVKIVCPVNKESIMVCPWEGIVKELKDHCQESHKSIFTEGDTFMSSSLKDVLKVIFHEKEIFLYYKIFKDERLHCAVQKFGLTRDNFVASFKLDMNNGYEKITMQQQVMKTDQDFKVLFESGKGMILHRKLYQKYIFEGNLALNIFIQKPKTKP